jgi:flagellar motility protein MotE (MotC chaperone)
MSEHLGRPLDRHEHVHHKNGVRDDNKLENLEIWSGSHPKGQRIDDKIKYALEILDQYVPELLKLFRADEIDEEIASLEKRKIKVAKEFDSMRGKICGLIEGINLGERQERSLVSTFKSITYDMQARILEEI